MEEESQFADPELLLPEDVTREELYQQHLASLQHVRLAYPPLNGMLNGHIDNQGSGHVHVNGNANGTMLNTTVNFSSQSSPSFHGSQRSIMSFEGMDLAMKTEPEAGWGSPLFGIAPGMASQAFTGEMNLATFPVLPDSRGNDTKLNKGVKINEYELNYDEWLRDDIDSIKDEKDNNEEDGEGKDKRTDVDI